MFDNANTRALFRAITRSDISEMESLLSQGLVDPNKVWDGDDDPVKVTPLSHAASWGNYGAIKLLLEYNANPRQRDAQGYSAMDYLQNYMDFFSGGDNRVPEDVLRCQELLNTWIAAYEHEEYLARRNDRFPKMSRPSSIPSSIPTPARQLNGMNLVVDQNGTILSARDNSANNAKTLVFFMDRLTGNAEKEAWYKTEFQILYMGWNTKIINASTSSEAMCNFLQRAHVWFPSVRAYKSSIMDTNIENYVEYTGRITADNLLAFVQFVDERESRCAARGSVCMANGVA